MLKYIEYYLSGIFCRLIGADLVKVDILGVKIDNITMADALKRTEDFFYGGSHMVFTPNPEIIMYAQKDEDFLSTLNSADLLLPDGIGVVIASKLKGSKIKERVPGFDFVCNLLKTGKTFYLFGGKPGVGQAAASNLEKQGVRVVGYHHGYFNDDEEIIKDILSKRPDVLLVCLGAPKQEKWIYKNKDRLNVPLCIGAGGSLDVLAGNVKRAPVIYQKLCLEWLYRAIKQPSRLPRLLCLPQFLIEVLFGGKQ